MKKPHKHKDLIIAWANGATIECNDCGVWFYANNPTWQEDMEYRIKPEPETNTEPEVKTQWMYIYNNAKEGKTWITPFSKGNYIDVATWTYMGKIEVHQ